jgi:precorrin-6B methylase 1
VVTSPGKKNMSVIEKFKSLPEAGRTPDSVWEVQKIVEQLSNLENQRLVMLRELVEANERMRKDLLKDWSEAEIKDAGLGGLL